MDRRLFTQALSTAVIAGSWLPHAAQAQALEQVKVLYGWPAGSAGDAVARRVADKLGNTPYSKNAAFVDNRPGAGGRISVDALKASPTDGSVIALLPVSMFGLNPLIFQKLNYQSADFARISTAAVMIHGLAVGPAVPAEVKTLKDFVAWCKQNPAQASFGSPAPGSLPHMLGAMLGLQAGINLRHVPYRGTVPSITDLVGGQIAATMNPSGDYLQYVKAGRLRVLAVSSTRRLPSLPDVPTFAEAGFPEITAEEWFGFYAPAQTPANRLSTAHAAITAALQDPSVQAAISAVGLVPSSSNGQTMLADEQAMLKTLAPVVQKIGFSVDS